jgi:hypothetical protein
MPEKRPELKFQCFFVSQDSDKDEISDCKSDLQHAICAFNVSPRTIQCSLDW